MSVRLLLLAAGMGLVVAGLILLFKQAIAGAEWLAYGWLADDWMGAPWLVVLVVPMVGGLLVGIIMHLTDKPDEPGHGVEEVIEAVTMGVRDIPTRRAPGRAAVAALSLGVGASLGPEDPAVEIGASAGDFLGRRGGVDRDGVQALIATGGAAGLAAAFYAPFAAVLFAIEVFALKPLSRTVAVVAMGAGVAYLVVRWVNPGPTPVIETLPLPGVWTVPLALVIGLLGGALSAALIRLLYALEHAVARWDGVPRWLKPAMGGAVLGLAGLAAPELLGIGYVTLEAVAAGELPGWELLLLFTVGKLLLMVVSFGSGFRGGFFAPSLFIGAMLGALCGVGAAAVLPGPGLEPAALATLGMAAVLAGAVRAPFTVALLIPALSGDYAQAPALLLAALAGTFVSRRLEQDSLYTYAIAHPAKEVDYDHPPRPQRDVRQRCRAMTIGQRRAPSGHGDDAPLSS